MTDSAKVAFLFPGQGAQAVGMGATVCGPSVFDTKLPTPLSDGFVADGDAPLCQKIFHISEAQAESVVEPNGMADNFMRESIAPVTKQVGFHPLSLLGSPQLDNTVRASGQGLRLL